MMRKIKNVKCFIDEKLSDLVGEVNVDIVKIPILNIILVLDQNYKDLNYNDLGTQMNFGALNVDFNYLKKKII